jgi:MFS family permease
MIEISKELDSKEVVTEVGENTIKKLSKEERRKAIEKRRDKKGFLALPSKMTGYLWFVLIFANIVSFFDGWGSIAIMLAMAGWGQTNLLRNFQQIGNPDLFTYFGLSNAPVIMGVVLSIAGIGVVAAVSFKFLVDKFGRRPLTLYTAVAFLFCALATAFSPPGPEGLLYFLIFRILANYFLSGDVVVIIIAEESPDHLRARLMGVVIGMSSIGGVACGIIQTLKIRVPIPNPWGFSFNWLGSMTVWQSLYFINIVGFVLIIPLFFFLKETKRFKAMKKYEDWRVKKGLKPKTTWFAPLKKKYIRPMALGMIGGFLFQVIYSAQVMFFGLYLTKQMNMSKELLGIVTLPILLAAALGIMIVGSLMDRWGRLPTIRFASYITLLGGTLISIPAVFVVGDIPNPVLQAIVVLGDMLGIFGLVITVAGVMILPVEMFPTHIRSTAMGWISAITRGAMILTPFLMMFGAEKVGGLGLSYHFMFIFMDMIFITAVYVIYMLAPESKGRSLEEIVGTEVYAGREKKEMKKESYLLYLIYIASFILLSFLYIQTTEATLGNMLIMLGFYTTLSLAGFVMVYYIRKNYM